jgi:hypothetical protein
MVWKNGHAFIFFNQSLFILAIQVLFSTW